MRGQGPRHDDRSPWAEPDDLAGPDHGAAGLVGADAHPPGLILRAVGENHDAAHALGYPVRRVRLPPSPLAAPWPGWAAPISIATVPQWTEGMTAGAGWIALAIVVFAQWNPGVLAGAWLFGGVTVLQAAPACRRRASRCRCSFLHGAPHLATILVLV